MSEDIDRSILRKYDIQARLGRGAYGVVWKALDRKKKSIVAVKKIFDAFQNRTDSQRTFREVSFLQSLHHPNVIRLMNVHRACNDRDLYLVFEHMETDLHSAIRAKILEPIHHKYIIYQLVKCLKYLHSAGLLHRDMKPSNLLLNSDCEVKVCDFGLARIIDEEEEGTNPSQQVLTDYVATRWYRAPEILLGSNYYTFGVDMWAVGCILGEMALGNPMFPGTSTMDQLSQILRITGYPSEGQIASIHSPFATTMLSNCRRDARRPILKIYPTLDLDAAHLLDRLMQFNPSKRLTTAETLKHPYLEEFHDPLNEPDAKRPITIKFDDNKQLSVEAYRDELYRMILQKKRESKKKRQHRKMKRSRSEASSKSRRKDTTPYTENSYTRSRTKADLYESRKPDFRRREKFGRKTTYY